MKKSYEEHKRHAFDSYCKRLLKNELRNYYKEINKRRAHEVSFSELSDKELNELPTYDTYFTDVHTFRISDYDVVVNDEAIAEALKKLPEHKRDIILLSYFLDMSDGEIGTRLNLVRSTVQHRRTSILKELKRFMEVKTDE